MVQCELFDPRATPTATAEMLADGDLKRSITALRALSGSRADGWPYVERLVECGGRTAWFIDDAGTRAVSIGGLLWRTDDLMLADRSIRVAASAAIQRLDSAPRNN